MKAKKYLLSSLMMLFALVLVSTVGSAATIFSDNFDDGDLSGWNVINNSVSGGSPWTNTGTFAEAKPGANSADGNSSISRTISTSGFQTIIVKYDRQLGGFDASDEFVASWSIDGTTFNVLEETLTSTPDDSNFVSKTFNLPASANNIATFQIKFECITDAQTAEFCRLDNVFIEGTAISTSALTLAPTTQTANVGGTVTLTLTNTGPTSLSGTISETTNFNAGVSPTTFSLAPSSNQAVTVLLSALNNLQFGSNNIQIRAASTSPATTATATINVLNTFCKSGETGGNLSITDVSITNNGDGDDNEWDLLDEIEVEVDVENEGDNDIDNVFVEIGLFDDSGQNQIGDVDFDSSDEEEYDLGDLNDGDKETATFTIRIPADMEPGSYKLAVKAYSDDLGENVECVSVASDLSNDDIYESIDINNKESDNNPIAFENIELLPAEAVCGEFVTLTTDVFNIGEDDEDQVLVRLYNNELGISEEFEIRKNLDVGDDAQVSFEFEIPQNAENKIYQLQLDAEYDYRNGNYRESLDDTQSVPLRILGCVPDGNDDEGQDRNFAAISASLESDAIAGQELTVKLTITNLQNTDEEFIVDVSDFNSWAELVDISDRIMDIRTGDSEEVTLTFRVNGDASGEQSFLVEVLSNDMTQEREISVNIESASGFEGFGNLGGNAFLWIIGAINVILIIVIIIVAVRVSRR